ncbi:MAG: hypothetical protein NZ482_10175 [Gloeomargarita sp. SKYG98]|nr:hypothetical protein [Gloeomargarita sp. SKYG98]
MFAAIDGPVGVGVVQVTTVNVDVKLPAKLNKNLPIQGASDGVEFNFGQASVVGQCLEQHQALLWA